MGQITKGRVLDSNILIYHINGQLDPSVERAIFCCIEQPAYVSVITSMEVLSWPGHSDESIAVTSALMEAFNEIALGKEIKSSAITIRRLYRLKLPDAIIAATALFLGMPLVTRNIKDFKDIPDLKLVNPFEQSNPPVH